MLNIVCDVFLPLQWRTSSLECSTATSGEMTTLGLTHKVSIMRFRNLEAATNSTLEPDILKDLVRKGRYRREPKPSEFIRAGAVGSACT
jgi:hypothetical protein